MIAQGRGRQRSSTWRASAGRRGEALVGLLLDQGRGDQFDPVGYWLDLIRHGIKQRDAPGVVDGEHWDGVDALFAG